MELLQKIDYPDEKVSSYLSRGMIIPREDSVGNTFQFVKRLSSFEISSLPSFIEFTSFP